MYWEGHRLQEEATKESLLKAIEKYKQALLLFQQVGDIFNQAETLSSMGKTYMDLDDAPSAVSCYEQAVQFQEKLKYYGNEGIDLVDLGFAYLKLENLEKATEAFQQALPLLREQGYYNDIADTLDGLAQIELKRRNGKAALDYMAQAVDAARTYGNKEKLAKKLTSAGIMAQDIGEYEKAENFLKEALALWQQLGSKREEGLTFYLLAKGREAEGDYQGAIDYDKKKAAIQDELGFIQNEGATYMDMALLAEKVPDLDQALTYLQRALALYADSADTRTLASLHFGIGTVYILRRDPEKAIPELRRAAELFEELGDTTNEANARLGLANAIYYHSGDKKVAAENYSKAADLFHGLNKLDKEAECDGKLGQILTDSGDEDQAIVYYKRAISLLEAAPNDQELGADWFGLGSIYDKRGDKNNALAAFVKAQPYLEKAKDTLREKIALLRISTIYTDQQQPDKALSYDERAVELFRQIGDKDAEATALYGVAIDLESLRRFREAIEAGDQAATIWKELDRAKDLGGCLLLTGRLRLNLGDDRFLNDLKDAVQYSKTANDLKTEAEALANLGLAYCLADHVTGAIEDFRQALALAAEIGDSKLRGTILSDLGLNYMFQGDRQTAIEYLLDAQQLQHSSGDQKGEAATLNSLGLLYAQLGNDEQGLADFNQALVLFRELKDIRLEAFALNSIGTLNLILKRNEEAVEFFNQAADLEKSLDKLEDITLVTEENLVFALDLAGQHKVAQERYRRLQMVLHDAGNRRVEATVLGNLGISYLRTGDYEDAWMALQQSLSLRTTIQDHDGLVLSLSGLAELERTIGNLDAARSLIEKALDQADWLRNKVTQGDLRVSYSAGLQDLDEFQITLLMQLHDLRRTEGFDRLAFVASERGRARTLVELLREARVDFSQGVDAASWERLNKLQHELAAKEQFYSSLALGSGNDEALQKLRTDITQLTSESLVAEEDIRKKSPQYASLTGSAPITLPDIQKKLLDRDTLLLEFALGEKASFLWIVSETDIRTFQLPARAQIEKLARSAYKDLTARTAIYEDKSGPSFELSKLLFADAVPLLLKKRLLIVPDGALNYIPFAALPDPAEFGPLAADNPKPMLLSHEIVCLPSASALMALRAQVAGRFPTSKAMMIFADPVFDKTDSRVNSVAVQTSPQLTPTSGLEVKIRGTLREFAVATGSMEFSASLPRLEGTRSEAMNIAGLLPPDSVRLHLDFEANRDAALSPDLANYRYVHFATHGLLDSDHPALSALALSLVRPDGTPQDGFLHTADIFNLKLQAELTTLSGCETGLGKELRGEGVLGLTRGCLYAGSKRVIVSLWKISDKATAKLMTNLYYNMLKNGETPAAALRDAQITMLNDPETKAPFYWAAFVVEGEWR